MRFALRRTPRVFGTSAASPNPRAVSITIAPRFLDTLPEPSAGQPLASGLLLGHRVNIPEGIRLELEEARPLPYALDEHHPLPTLECEHLAQIVNGWFARPHEHSAILGLCRTGQHPGSTPADRRLFQFLFPGDPKVLLVLAQQTVTAIPWDGQRFLPMPTYQRSSLVNLVQDQVGGLAFPGAFPYQPANERPSRLTPWLWGGTLLLAAALAWPTLAPRLRPGNAVSRTPQFLGFSVESVGTGLVLRWDAQQEPARSATNGTLLVREGTVQRAIPLDQEQVRRGSMVYFGGGSDLDLRLVLDIPHQAPLQGAARVIVARGPSAITYSVPDLQNSLLQPVGQAPVPNGTEGARPAKTPPPLLKLTSPSPRQPQVASPEMLSVDAPVIPHTSPSLTAGHEPVSLGMSLPAPAWEPKAPETPGRPPAQSTPTANAGFKAATPVRQVRPTVPPEIRQMIRSPIEVQVRLNVGPDGRVTNAEALGTTGPPASYLREVAAIAARQWQFAPARQGAQPVASELVLKFVFTR